MRKNVVSSVRREKVQKGVEIYRLQADPYFIYYERDARIVPCGT